MKISNIMKKPCFIDLKASFLGIVFSFNFKLTKSDN